MIPADQVVAEHAVPDDERMVPIELQSVREFLGLSQEALAAHLHVAGRTVRHWESGRYRIPDGIRIAVEALENDTAEVVDALVRALADARDPAVAVYREDAHYRAAGGRHTARWWRHIVMRAVIEVPGVVIIDADTPPDP